MSPRKRTWDPFELAIGDRTRVHPHSGHIFLEGMPPDRLDFCVSEFRHIDSKGFSHQQ